MNRFNCWIWVLVVFELFVQCVAAGVYDPLSDLDAYNVVWATHSADHNGSMPLGNGDIGVNLWCEADGDLIFYISKMDAWSENGRFLKLGRIRVSMTPNPFATGKPFRQELVLRNGMITVTAGTPGSDEVRLRMRISATQPLICIDADSDIALSWKAKLEVCVGAHDI